MATQQERRDQTRRALLDAAAELFAARGIDGASVDAIAEAAGRTSGAVYDHFGSKEGLLFALLEGWVDDVAAVITAELATAATLEERMAALWRNVSDPPTGDGRWIDLEHELWRYATRNAAAGASLGARYRVFWDSVDDAAREWAGSPAPGTGIALIALLLGLDMMRRLDPVAVSDELAIASLSAVVNRTATSPASSPAGRNRSAPTKGTTG